MNYQYTTKKPYGIDDYEPFNYQGFFIEEIPLTKETEHTLFRLFEELDALLFDYLPDSLTLRPVQLIQREYRTRTGLFLTQQEILDAYKRFEGGFYD